MVSELRGFSFYPPDEALVHNETFLFLFPLQMEQRESLIANEEHLRTPSPARSAAIHHT